MIHGFGRAVVFRRARESCHQWRDFPTADVVDRRVRSTSGSLAMLAAMRRASSRLLT
jgi:hypothetical protein